jgi:hypothetical protein
MTDVTTYDDTRELAYRANDGVEVALLWYASGDVVSVVVSDARTGESFELVLDRDDRAMDVFHHPYAYAAHRGLELRAVPREREAELVLAT